MATFNKHVDSSGKTSWRVRVRKKGFPVETATFDRKTDAQIWAKKIESAMQEGRYFPENKSKKRTLKELIERYEKEVLPLKKGEKNQGIQLAYWKKTLGHLMLSQVTSSILAEARETLANEPTPKGGKRANGTVNRYLAALSHPLTVAWKEWEWLTEQPMKKVTRRKESQGRVRYLEDAEIKALIAACKSSDHSDLYAVALIALTTGMRQGEILGVRWPSVDLGRARLTVEDSKNGDRRGLPLSPQVVDLLKERSKLRDLNDDRVFQVRGDVLHKPWKEALKASKINNFRFHDLRHCAASFLAMNHATPSEIAAILGHKTLQMVKRYAHLSDAHTKDVLESMHNKFLSGVG